MSRDLHRHPGSGPCVERPRATDGGSPGKRTQVEMIVPARREAGVFRQEEAGGKAGAGASDPSQALVEWHATVGTLLEEAGSLMTLIGTDDPGTPAVIADARDRADRALNLVQGSSDPDFVLRGNA